MHKIVNGKQVPLTADEIAEREAAAIEHEAMQVELTKTQYQRDRAEQYPSIGDQLDAILKQLNYMQLSGQTNLITELDSVISRWLKVKRDYPKPDSK